MSKCTVGNAITIHNIFFYVTTIGCEEYTAIQENKSLVHFNLKTRRKKKSYITKCCPFVVATSELVLISKLWI
jgi:hypothetical protein